MKNLILFLFILTFSRLSAQEYDIVNIPDSLMKNVNIVVRYEKMDYVVKSQSKATEKQIQVFTLLNKNADVYADLGVVYDKLSSISQLSAIVYDAKGIKVKEYKNNDFNDRSLISSFSIFEDNRIKSLTIHYPTYPYTIKFSYVKEHSGILSYPSWYPQTGFNMSVQQADYEISYPKEMAVRFKTNKTNAPIIIAKDKLNSANFSIKNLKAYTHEPFTNGLLDITPWAWVAPTSFEFDGYPGNMENWKNFGEWLYSLSKDLAELPPHIKTEVKSLTDKFDDPKEKVKVLYKYLQSKSRYVSVQLGIGGFRPFSAEKVALNNYGDCKALSNYMLALLKEAGIKSHLVVVGANPKKGLNNEFSSVSQANHMILCVPMQKDSIWLECTSQRAPFNYLGSFTEGRNVLLITPNGGKIVKTPTISPTQNSQNRTIDVIIDSLGNAKIKLQTIYSGEQFEDIEGQLYRDAKAQKDYLYDNLQTENATILNYTYIQPDKDDPSINEDIELSLEKILVSGGNNKFLTLNLLNKKTSVPETMDNRKTNFKTSMNYVDRDEIIFNIPKNFKVEHLPKDIELKTEFGIYKATVKLIGNKLVYNREQTMYKKVYPAEKFNEFAAFYKAIYRADKQKAVLVSAN